MSRALDTAKSQQSNSGPIPPFVAGKNAIINGGFDIWQRGTSNVTTYLAYTADRWQKGGGTHFGISRTTVSDTTNLPFIQYAARMQRTTSSATTTLMDFGYSMETADAIKFAGQRVTLSFYARKGANYSGAAGASFGFALYTGTGTDQSLMLGYTGSAATLNTGTTLTTSMARYSETVTIPTTTTEIGLYFSYTPTGTAGANDYVDITGVQLELGSTATPFSRNSGTIHGELSACQRYFEKTYSQGISPGTAVSVATNSGSAAITGPTSTSFLYGVTYYKVTKRTVPTITFYDMAGTSGKCSRATVGSPLVDNNVIQTDYVGDSNFTCYSSAGTSANVALFQYVANAEL
jgi:hypothetical protein